MLPDRLILVHLHVGKTAGTAVNRALRSRFPQSQYLHVKGGRGRLDELNARIEDGTIHKVKAVAGHIDYGMVSGIAKHCLCFSLFREPVARICSFFNFIHTTPHHKLHDQFKELRFDDLNKVATFVPHQIERLGHQWASSSCRQLTGLHNAKATPFTHFWPMIEERLDSGRLVVGDVPHISTFLGDNGVINGPLPHVRKTDVDRFDDFVPASPKTLTDAARHYIEDLNANDVKLMEKLLERGHMRQPGTKPEPVQQKS
ncbi:MAG: hypothetical protein AAF615_08235 [Pseudomonadota bacterium]